MIAFWFESAREKQCAGRAMNVVPGSVIWKINMCTSSVWSVYIKNISLSYSGLPSVSAVSFRGSESIKIHDQMTKVHGKYT